MIKWIHQNKRSVTVFLLAGVVVLSMSFFQVDLGATREQRYAIKINDEKISFDRFNEEKQERQQSIPAEYRRFYNIPNQQIADGIIAQELLIKEATRLGLFVGDEELKNFIKKDMPGGTFDPKIYSAYLTYRRKTSQQFEEELRRQLLIDNLQTILSDISIPSKYEIERFITEQETTYDASYIEFDPVNFEKDVNVSEDGLLEKYYNEHQTDFEIPAQAQYTYVVFDPEKNANLIEISKDDIELYYSDNESDFMTPEEHRVRQIVINIPKDADDKKKEELKKKAEEAHAKASAGEVFESLVKLYSDDLATMSSNGDLGWIKKGQLDKALEQKVLKLKGQGVTEIITTPEAYKIAKVEEYKAPQLKKLEEVRTQIETELKKREGPAFLLAKAHEVFDKWSKSDKPLAEYTTPLNLNIQSTTKALDRNNDPEPTLKGLSEQILAKAKTKKQLLELGDKSVLVQIDKYDESRIPSYAEAKEKVIAAYKKVESKKICQQKASDILEGLKAGTFADLKAVANQLKIKLAEQTNISKKTARSGIFTDKDIESAVFSSAVPESKPSKVYSISDKHYLLTVTKITPPKPEDVASKFDTFKEQAKQRNASILFQSNLNRLKAQAEIDVDRSLLRESSES
jgi:peptidyl-prolyl cis-trans isomerase D